MATSRRDFLKKGSLIAVAATVPTSIVHGFSSIEKVAPLSAGFELNKADFLAQLNTEFRIRQARTQVVVKLVEVKDLKYRKGARKEKEGFSLLFRESNVAGLNQGTYEILHEKLGKFSFLLVPVPSRRKDGVSYEAIVNRLYS